MTASNSQMIGLGVVGALIVIAAIFLRYVVPGVDAIFRPSLRTAIYWFIGILLIQTGFMLAGG
ncbi:MAG: hypothetical protein Q8L35_04135 [Actinomycetota bacterium]|nr:hypothetical protein [Actinomycetota bacterium]